MQIKLSLHTLEFKKNHQISAQNQHQTEGHFTENMNRKWTQKCPLNVG